MERYNQISTTALSNDANRFTEKADQINNLYDQLNKEIANVTEKGVWDSEAGKEFYNKNEELKPEIKQLLGKLNRLGPAFTRISDKYYNEETDNTSNIRKIQ